MNAFRVALTCTVCKGAASVTLTGVTRAYAETYAGLVTGRSELYLYPPGPDSLIGRYDLCQGPLVATVSEAPEA